MTRLPRRVTLQYIADGQDDHGQPSGAWTDYRTCNADIREGLGREGLRGDQVEHGGMVKIEIMHPRQGRFPAVEHRATWTEHDTDSTRTANISHIERKGHDRKRIILHCTEVG